MIKMKQMLYMIRQIAKLIKAVWITVLHQFGVCFLFVCSLFFFLKSRITWMDICLKQKKNKPKLKSP